MKPKFEATDEGLEIIDPIERRRYHLTTHRPTTPEPADQHGIPFPLGSAVRIRTDRLTLPTTNTVLVRDAEGVMKTQVQSDDQAYLPRDDYLLDISGSVKTYAKVESSAYVYSAAERTHIILGDTTSIVIGARSFHKRPAETITTTTDPADIMDAVSAFRSALKTTSPERAYPTLRGHPPRLELGDELEIPDALEYSEPDVRIEIPPTLRHIFVITPLTYYLGAEVVPGPNPQLVTESGYTHSLTDDGFERAVERTLKQLFLLDCVVRTEGTTPLPLYRREALESRLEFDLATMYDRPLGERVEAYLNVDVDDIESYYPNWRLEIELAPADDAIEFLPFLANELAIVRTDDDGTESTPAPPETIRAVEDFTRDDFTRSTSSTRGGQSTTATSRSDAESIPTITQSWEGIRGSRISSTTPISAFYNDIGRTPREDPIEIEVVCNDAKMREELESVNGTYGTHKQLPFNTTVNYDVTTDGLEGVLASECDFFHYIGHIDEQGFQCTDGKLDAATVDSVGAKAFLLNACQSHNQGIHLVEAGSIGGIVTLGDVVNSGAVKIGSIVAQLLNCGFPLYAALDIARIENVVGQQYLIAGDGRTTISQPETPLPDICVVETEGESNYISLIAYGGVGTGKGGVFTPDLDFVDTYYIVPDQTERIPVTDSSLEGFFEQARFPILVGEQIYWSEDLEPGEL